MGQFGLQIERNAENNLKIFNGNSSGNPETDNWFNVRPALLSEAVNDESETAGIKTYKYPDLPGVSGYYHQFIKDGKLFRQTMYPMPVDWNSLKSFLNDLPGAEIVSLSSEGLLFVRLNGVDFVGRLDAEVNPADSTHPATGRIQLIGLGDSNADGRADYKDVYPKGEWQILYLLN